MSDHPTGWYTTPDGDEVHIYAAGLSDEAKAQIVGLIRDFKRKEKERKMAYQVGEEVQFVQRVTRTNPDRVINIDEKASITAVAIITSLMSGPAIKQLILRPGASAAENSPVQQTSSR